MKPSETQHDVYKDLVQTLKRDKKILACLLILMGAALLADFIYLGHLLLEIYPITAS